MQAAIAPHSKLWGFLAALDDSGQSDITGRKPDLTQDQRVSRAKTIKGAVERERSDKYGYWYYCGLVSTERAWIWLAPGLMTWFQLKIISRKMMILRNPRPLLSRWVERPFNGLQQIEIGMNSEPKMKGLCAKQTEFRPEKLSLTILERSIPFTIWKTCLRHDREDRNLKKSKR